MPTYLALLAMLVFMSVLIAGYFYIAWVKARDNHANRPQSGGTKLDDAKGGTTDVR